LENAIAPPRWQVIPHSVRGALHERQSVPNQDAIGAWAAGNGLAPVILAVSDGHGSPRSFRSHEGARIAVRTALDTCRAFLAELSNSAPAVVKRAADDDLPRQLVRSWRERVDRDFRARPFSDKELELLEQEAGVTARAAPCAPGSHFIAYGATLLVAVVTDSCNLYLQLGDGDIVVVSETGVATWALPDIPKENVLVANETYSLCLEGAAQMFRVGFQRAYGAAPALIMLSTDGYINSFADANGFLQVSTDLLTMLRNDGIELVESRLPQWLDEASRAGSGDDITVGLIYRREPVVSALDRRDTTRASASHGESQSPVEGGQASREEGPARAVECTGERAADHGGKGMISERSAIEVAEPTTPEACAASGGLRSPRSSASTRDGVIASFRCEEMVRWGLVR
jgi:hypothetical protein